jgi:Radical SAM superfamily
MRVGVLDILALPSQGPAEAVYHTLITKQFASITPQAISVWCRRLGHDTFYAVYYGSGDARRLLPADLDLVFIACYTQASPIAYALGLLYRGAGTRTVVGGPHAKAFPVDCLRFFDLVVQDCDQALIADILAGQFDPGSVISSARPFDDVPTVEERMPEIRASAFYWRGRPLPLSTIPMLASTGCPYRCDFCIDWDNAYRQLPTDRLAADVRYLAGRLPGTLIVFHDPNFAVRFDQVFEVLESVPRPVRPPYMMEATLTVLRGDRLARLKATNCALVAPGVESWTDYSNKAGLGRTAGLEKVDRVVEHFHRLHENVPYLQANFMFGLDSDSGPQPAELTRLFMDRTPFVWPAINIPMPFGGTPVYQELVRENRILRAMPFGFYYAPYLVTTLKHYDPVTYYEQLVDLLGHASAPAMLRRRLASTGNRKIRLVHRIRTAGMRATLNSYRRILGMLRSDPRFRAFHEGRSAALPEFYQRRYQKMLGPYAGVLSAADRVPDLDPGPL